MDLEARVTALEAQVKALAGVNTLLSDALKNYTLVITQLKDSLTELYVNNIVSQGMTTYLMRERFGMSDEDIEQLRQDYKRQAGKTIQGS